MADDPQTALEGLIAVLSEAGALGRQVLRDDVLVRLLTAFHELPEADREVLVGVLEREVAWCRIAEQTAGTTGITVRPNPFASFYVQVVGEPQEPQPSERDVDVIRLGIERLAHLVPLIFGDNLHAQWTVSAHALARLIDPAIGRDVVRFAREILAIVAEERPQLLEPDGS